MVTVTSATPADLAGAVAVIDVEDTTVTLVADVPPKLTVDPDRNPVPVIVTTVPPEEEPDVGLIEVIVGTA